MKIVDSTDGVIYSNKRRSGVTTRVADNIIQQLFSGHRVRFIDFSGPTFHHSRRLKNIVFDRLRIEHNIGMALIEISEDSGGFIVNLKDRDG